jgi:hypothetical protein
MDSTDAERIANELAALVAQEHRRANEEQARREAAEATASELAAQLARSEARVREFAELMLGAGARPEPRFVPATRGTPRPRGVLRRMSSLS